ncbi:hypothetical protein ZHAS_00001034 [Anopheles sinensis]|uniref:Uncharacterized protein n=1 Tax=Anopheles sinensis TaxID=74873 RepID=A0A084VAX0_ANOSI|nr:hypothetical protein ZHAS_00001034 [Anopheles sinensis]
MKVPTRSAAISPEQQKQQQQHQRRSGRSVVSASPGDSSPVSTVPRLTSAMNRRMH